MRSWALAVPLVLALPVAARAQGEANSSQTAGSAAARLGRAAPVSTLSGFVVNRGQWPDEVEFFASRGGIDATLLTDAIVFRPLPDIETGEWPLPLVLRFSAAETVEGQGALPTAHHFLLAEGRTSHVPGFDHVVYRDLAPGIDLLVRCDRERFAFDVHVAAGADLAELQIELDGADFHDLPFGEVLVSTTDAWRVEQRLGAAWEVDEAGERVPLESRFLVEPAGLDRVVVRFEAPARNLNRPLVIDPTLVWATYVGGVSQELLEDMAVAPDGSAYLAVKSNSTGPTTPGAFIPGKPPGTNGWAGKLSPDGSTLEWGTFLGGSDTEAVAGIEVDQDGSVLFLGDTWSPDFPVTAGTVQPAFAGKNDMFLCRLLPDGSGLVWSTFYGGVENDHADTSTLHPSGDIVFSGDMETALPPATPGAFDTVFDAGDDFLLRLTADGTTVVFQTYFAANVHDLACADAGTIVFGGSADASLPTTPNAFQPELVNGDASSGFVARMNGLGSDLIWSTFLGGSLAPSFDHVIGVAVDAAGAVYACGSTPSPDFPVTLGAFAASSADSDSGFVTKLLPGGTGLVWSTYIGACCGGAADALRDIAVDSAGNAIAVGDSNEPGFPTTPDAFQPTYIGSFPSSDAHLTKFDAFGETLVYSTYFGGNGSDGMPRIGFDAAENPLIGFQSSSSTIPVTPGAYDGTFAGSTDSAVAKFNLPVLPWKVLGGGMAGAIDTPNLAGTGALTLGSPARFSVRGAAASSAASLVAGLTMANLYFKGGTMVPFPTIILTLATSAQGALDLPFTWVNVPPGIDLYVQVWIQDAGASAGFSATNALGMTSQ